MSDPLGRTFLATGAAYERYRPGFPDAAVDVILPDPVDSVLDLGAGTGKLTERLVDRAARVWAIDPSAQMLAELRRKLPEVTVAIAPAEDLPLPTSSQDVVAVAQAFHWFDVVPACREIARVLRPGGVLALLWNGPARTCGWDLACQEVAHPGSTTAVPESRRDVPGFRLVAENELSWSESILRTDYVARWLTVSTFLAADDDLRREMVEAVETILDDHPDTRGRESLVLPHRTLVERYVVDSG